MATTELQGRPLPDAIAQRAIHAGLGLVIGSLLYVISELMGAGSLRPAAQTGMAVCGVAALMSYRRGDEARVAAFGIGLGVILGLILFYIRSLLGDLSDDTPALALVASSLVVSYVALAFFQAWQEEGASLSYQALFVHAWSNVLVLGVAAGFTLAAFLVLFLWGAMFKLVGVSVFKDMFEAKLFAFPFYGAVFGLSVALTREYERIILALRTLAVTLCRLLAPVLAVASLLFLLVLPFTGLQPLWATGSATPILLCVIIASVLFVNAVVRYGQEDTGFPAVARYPVMAQLAVLPVFAVLAFYSTWLRVAQYGLTPEREYALVIVVVMGLHAFAYAAAVILGRAGWWRGIIRVNPVLAVVTVFAALAVHLPGVTPYHLSARDQYARLADGTVKAEDFDFGLLKYRLGQPGQAALARIEADQALPDRAAVTAELARLEETTTYYEWQAGNPPEHQLTPQKRDVAAYMTLVPADLVVPERVLSVFESGPLDELDRCLNGQDCAMVQLDADGDGAAEYAFFSMNDYVANGFLIHGSGEPERWVRSQMGTLRLSGPEERKGFLDALRKGGISLVTPRFRNIRIGDWLFFPNQAEDSPDNPAVIPGGRAE